MHSVWNKEVTIPLFAPLEGERKTDVLIIGGGMAGVLCAYFLEKAGVDYCLVEAERIGSGVTGGTTAKITVQHGFIYHKIEEKYGQEAAFRYLDAQQSALDCFRLLGKQIDCEFEEKDNYVYSSGDCDKPEREMRTLERIGGKAAFFQQLPLPVSICGAVSFPAQAQFHPLKFLAGIANGLRIYENTKVEGFDGKKVMTNRGTVYADKIIVATHFPIINKHGFYFAKMYQHRSYVLELDNVPRLDGMFVDEDKNGLSFRCYQNKLLLGGGGHRTGKQDGGYGSLRQRAEEFYPDACEKGHWATQDCITLDDIPYIGKYGKRTEDIYAATGFNKWGMTSSMVAAMVLKDAVLGRENKYESLFCPYRRMLGGRLIKNLAESVNGLLRLSPRRCPHLGCALKWNKEERSWDCPCHGSRFSEKGEVLDNPANGDLK